MQTRVDSNPDSLRYNKDYTVYFNYNTQHNLRRIKGKLLGQPKTHVAVAFKRKFNHKSVGRKF
jgi:hypothetical protein